MSRGFGRVFLFDGRDSNYMIREHFDARPQELRRKLYRGSGWLGDVGDKPWAVEYAWRAAICDSGRELDLEYGKFYRLCRQKERNGANTTVRAGAKVLQDMGMLSEYHWAFDAEDVITAVLTLGPVVMGTDWYAAMNYPSATGLIKLDGSKVGEHAYLINGVDLEKGTVRIKNCWGKTWGKGGYAHLAVESLEKLMWENGDGCYAALSKTRLPAVRLETSIHRAAVESSESPELHHNLDIEPADAASF